MTFGSLGTHPDRTERFWAGDVGTEAPDRSRAADLLKSLESGFSGSQGRGAAFTATVLTLSPEASGVFAVEFSLPRHIEVILKTRFGIFDFKQALNSVATIEDVSKLLVMAGMRKSAERLQVLKSCEKDLEEGDKPLCLDPVLNYAEFICLFDGFGEPALAVSPDGILGASWKFEDGRYLKLRFFPGDRIIYAAILPGTEPGNPERMYGHGCRSDVMRALRARGLDG